jgi:hypothetical protein
VCEAKPATENLLPRSTDMARRKTSRELELEKKLEAAKERISDLEAYISEGAELLPEGDDDDDESGDDE